MQFKQMMAMKDDISSLSKKRHQESDVSFLKGKELLLKAHESGFTQKELLHEAIDAFMASLQHNRRNPDPCVCIAYLLLILGDKNKAIKYINEARRVSPSHTDALALLGAIEAHEIHLQALANQEELAEGELPAPVAPEMIDIMSLPVLSAERDYDLLYDQIEDLLIDKTRELMEHQQGLQVTLNLEELEPLKVQGRNLKTLVRHVDRQIQVIDREIDTSELRQKLHPLEAMLRRIVSVRKSSQQLVQVNTECLDILDKAQSLNQAIKGGSHTSPPDSALDHILDECDRIADILDEISEQGHKIELAEDNYQSLCKAVENLQDTFDDLFD